MLTSQSSRFCRVNQMQPSSEHDPGKRRRAFETPLSVARPTVALTPQTSDRPNAQSTSELLDYLKGRGGKIRELEDEAGRHKAACEQLQALLDMKSTQLLRVTAELQVAKGQAAGPNREVVLELEALLDEELAKGLQLERDLSTSREEQAQLQYQLKLSGEEQASQAASHAHMLTLLRDQLAEAQAAERAVRKEADDIDNRRRRAAEQAALDRTMEQQRLRATEQDLRSACDKIHQLKVSLAELTAKSAAAALRHSTTSPPPNHQQPTFASHHQASPGQVSVDPKPTCTPAILSSVTGTKAELAANLAELQNTCSQWQKVGMMVCKHAVAGISDGGSSGSPLWRQTQEALEQQLHELSELRRVMGSRDEQLIAARMLAGSAEQQLAALQQQVDESCSQLERALLAEAVAQRKLVAVEQERNYLRQALTNPIPHELTDTPVSRLHLAQQASRAAQLETQNGSLQQQVQDLQATLGEAAAKESASQAAAAKCKATAEAATARCKQLEKEADGLARDVAVLQEKLGRGDSITGSSVRILHLRHNPESSGQRQAADARLQQLEAENAELLRSMASLEKQHDDALAAQSHTPGSGVAAAPIQQGGAAAAAVKEAELTVLRHKVAELDKAMGRLKSIFKERITAFREACNLLFGYKMEMTSEATAVADAASAATTYSLKPKNDDDKGAQLVFRYTKERGMKLVETDFTRNRLQREVDTFITKFESIPAFTATLTMENFQKQTQG